MHYIILPDCGISDNDLVRRPDIIKGKDAIPGNNPWHVTLVTNFVRSTISRSFLASLLIGIRIAYYSGKIAIKDNFSDLYFVFCL